MTDVGDRVLPAGQPLRVSRAETFDFTSRAGAEFRISVGLPGSYESGARRYPVLYVLDADWIFLTMLEISRIRAGETGEIVVVGIGYPPETEYVTHVHRRTYDFSTAEWDFTTPLGQEVVRVMNAVAGKPPSLGGAPALLDFITEEVQPFINERYRLTPDDQGLFGWSAGANFAAHALFRRPDAFSRYIMASPGFNYNDWDVFRLEEEYAASHSDLPATVYLSAGSNETTTLAMGNLVSGTVRMAETLHLRHYPSLHLTCEIFPGKTHSTACLEAMQRGLEVCWPGTPYEFSAAHAEAHLKGEEVSGVRFLTPDT